MYSDWGGDNIISNARDFNTVVNNKKDLPSTLLCNVEVWKSNGVTCFAMG